MSRIIKFAIATAMRQEEICRVTWDDLNLRTKMLTIRDRKDPREKKGNDQRIPLLAVSGYDAVALVEEQRAIRVSVTLSELSPANARQLDLLLDDDDEHKKCELITNMIDGLNRKFGKRVVTLGPWTPPPGT